MTDTPLVCVLLSAYNGEKYIEEQLKSVLAQTYKNIKIIVRDDGSTDGTKNIVKKYENITLIEGENIGFCKSFYELLKCAEGDYFAFCDQDDYWFENKIATAVNWLNNRKNDVPAMFHSGYEITDENLQTMEYYKKPPYEYDFRRCLTENIYSGFSIVINQKMREELLKFDFGKLDYHDWLCGAIANGFGEVEFDDTPMAKYRRLSTSQSRESFAKRIKWFFASSEGESNIKKRSKEFLRVYGDKLSAEKLSVLQLFCDEKYSLTHSLKKAFYPKRWRPNMASELSLRFLMLGGKV